MGAKPSSGVVSTLASDIEKQCSDKISLHSSGISDQEVLQLALLLKGNRSIREVRLKNCFVNHIGTSYIANVLQETSITRLFLSCNIGIRDRGALALMIALPGSSVQELSLDTTNITDKTARVLASTLPRCPNLRTLYLGGNDISDVGASLLAEALPRSQVTRLYLSSSKIRDLGAKSLANALKKHRLEVLTLSANYISDIGARYLADGLAQCPTLEKIDLSCNDVTDESVTSFIAAVQRHPSIKTVCFQYTATSASKIQELDFTIARLQTRKAKLMTLLCACVMKESRRKTVIAELPLELIRCLSSMLFI